MDGRRPRRGARAVLAAGTLAGLAYLAHAAAVAPQEFGLDYRVFHVAVEAALSGRDLYAAVPPGLAPMFHYAYPPITILGFLPFGLLGGWQLGYLAFTALTVLAGLAAARLLIRYVERAGDGALPTLDRLLVAGFVVASVHSMPSLVFGQTNHGLLLALVVGVLGLDRDRQLTAGAAFGLAALYKPFLAGIGLWLLRRRAWRAILAAVAVGMGGLAASLVAFGPETMRAYLEKALLPRLTADSAAGTGGIEPTATIVSLRRPISALLPNVDPSLYGPLALLVLAPAVLALYLTVEDRTDRLVSILGTLVGLLLVLPSYPVYVVFCYVALIPLLYGLEDGWPYRLLVAGGLVATVAVQYDEIQQLVAALDAPPVTAAAETMLRPLFTVATPPLVGLLLLLVACLWHRRARHGPFLAQVRRG